ncbi:hypothetical protein Tco_1516049 [Tanacetum coccineum]
MVYQAYVPLKLIFIYIQALAMLVVPLVMGIDVTILLEFPNQFSTFYALELTCRGVYLQLYYHYILFRGKKSSSRPSVDTSKSTHIQCKRSLLYFSPSTSGLTISASTHLRNLYISKKIPSQCQYQVYTFGSSIPPLLTSTPTILGLDTSS